MKYTVLFLALLVAATYCHFDFTHHQNGHELVVSFKDEASKIWVVFVESNDPANEGIPDENKKVKSAIKDNLVNEDVYYTEVDLTDAEAIKKYAEFTNTTSIDLEKLKEGPLVVLVHNKKGYWIHGHGIPQETVDTIHSFIAQKEGDQNKNQQISVGSKTNHPSSYESYGGGY